MLRYQLSGGTSPSLGFGATTRPNREDILLGPERTVAEWSDLVGALDSQHFLNFFPDPQGHGSFSPGLSIIISCKSVAQQV